MSTSGVVITVWRDTTGPGWFWTAYVEGKPAGKGNEPSYVRATEEAFSSATDHENGAVA